MTMPREVLFKNGYLIQRPVKELYELLGQSIQGNIEGEKIVSQT